MSVGDNLKTFLYLLEDKTGHAKVNWAERLQGLCWHQGLGLFETVTSAWPSSYLFEHYFDNIIQTVSSTGPPVPHLRLSGLDFLLKAKQDKFFFQNPK